MKIHFAKRKLRKSLFASKTGGYESSGPKRGTSVFDAIFNRNFVGPPAIFSGHTTAKVSFFHFFFFFFFFFFVIEFLKEINNK